ncbi:hypothetical protein HMPREF9004_1451 [Schaalia cardiffensis F0333]|uniref:Uncharacterized protein n=1 Tax=Schaalia cardiffensis F0333 TaxID=888050 RepID=N6X165_9ACTO|nr:hypothetical protein HMPREF9004_1451 [Schaalia cardiffensis F0333]
MGMRFFQKLQGTRLSDNADQVPWQRETDRLGALLRDSEGLCDELECAVLLEVMGRWRAMGREAHVCRAACSEDGPKGLLDQRDTRNLQNDHPLPHQGLRSRTTPTPKPEVENRTLTKA